MKTFIHYLYSLIFLGAISCKENNNLYLKDNENSFLIDTSFKKENIMIITKRSKLDSSRVKSVCYYDSNILFKKEMYDNHSQLTQSIEWDQNIGSRVISYFDNKELIKVNFMLHESLVQTHELDKKLKIVKVKQYYKNKLSKILFYDIDHIFIFDIFSSLNPEKYLLRIDSLDKKGLITRKNF